MVQSKRLLALGAFLLAGCVAQTDTEIPDRAQEALSLIPANMEVVGYANADGLLETVEAFIEMEESWHAEEAWAEALEVLQRINFDPRSDLDHVVAYASRDQEPVAVAVGHFDAESIGRVLEEEGADIRAVHSDGMVAWVITDHGHSVAVGITGDGGRAFVGHDLAALEAAMKVRGGNELASVGAPVMGMDSWMVVRDLPNRVDERGPAANLMRAVQTAAVGGSLSTETAAGTIALYPRSDVETADLAALVRGVVAAMRLQNLPDEAREQLEEIRVRDRDSHVLVTGAVNLDLLKRLNGA